MKTYIRSILLSSLSIVFSSSAFSQPTTFTYQGRLNNGPNPANGSYDFQFRVAADALGVNYVGGTLLSNGVPVANGLFAVNLDFGPGVFNGSNYWLEIGVRTNGAGSFTTLAPRQELTPTPYAIFAGTASNFNGTVSSSQVSGTYGNPVTFNNGANTFDGTFNGQFFGSTFTGGSFVGGNFFGSGSGLVDVWHTGGNAGTTPASQFVGTTDNQPLNFRVNNQRVMSLIPTTNSPNVMAGHPGNYIAPGVYGATIGGGGTPSYPGGSGLTNRVLANFATVGGGAGNLASGAISPGGDSATVAGGWANQAWGNNAVVSGGAGNIVFGDNSSIGGGAYNVANTNAPYSAIAGGYDNVINSQGATIGGGWYHLVDSNSSLVTISGGYNHKIGTNAGWTTIGGGYQHAIRSSSYDAVIGGGYVNVIDSNSVAATISGGYVNSIGTNAAITTIGGGYANAILSNGGSDTIAGGEANTNASYRSTIGGGWLNQIGTTSWEATIAGGSVNSIGTNSIYGAVGGGRQNSIATGAAYSTVPGGLLNSANASFSLAAGRRAQANHQGSFVWADSTDADFSSTANDQFSVRAGNGVVVQAASPTNTALELRSGQLKVTGAGIGTSTAAFIHLTAANNVSSYVTFIDNPVCNGDPNAILLVTHSYNPPNGTTATYHPHIVSLWYTGSQWAIFNEDFANMQTNIAFNILVIKH
jgi:trimeric autotransporter adhesin